MEGEINLLHGKSTSGHDISAALLRYMVLGWGVRSSLSFVRSFGALRGDGVGSGQSVSRLDNI